MRTQILVLLVLALSQTLLVSVQASCGSSGAAEGSYCNCYAGASPDYTSGVDNCAITQSGCTLGTTDDDLVTGNYAPKLVDAANPVAFLRDSVIIKFTQPTRLGAAWARQASYIKFYYGTTAGGATGASSCAYPGSLWTKVASSACSDEYTFSMPWSSYNRCGFSKVATAAMLTYTTTIEFSYNVVNGSITRVVSSLFNINIQLARQQLVTAALQLQLDPTSVATVDAVIVSGSAYDLLAGSTKLVFQTQTSWPYKIASPITTPSSAGPTATSPTNTNTVVTPDYQYIDDCPTTPNSICTQQFQVTISTTGGLCDLYGDYVISTSLVCSDIATCTLTTGPTITLSVDHTNICTPSIAQPAGPISHQLLSFGDSDFTESKSDFATGDKSWWTFVISDPSVSIDSVSLNTVALYTVPESPDVVYAAGSAPSAAIQVLHPGGTTPTVYPPGTPVVVAFQLTLGRGYLPNTVGQLVPGDSPTSINIEVSVDVEYHGNKKRTLSGFASRGVMQGGQPSAVASFVFRAKPEAETILSISKRASEQAQQQRQQQNSLCTGSGRFLCVASSITSKVLSKLGL